MITLFYTLDNDYFGDLEARVLVSKSVSSEYQCIEVLG